MSSADRVLKALFCAEQRVQRWTPLQQIYEDSEFRLAAEEERVCSAIRRGRICDFVYTLSLDRSMEDVDEAIDALLAGFLEARARVLMLEV